MNNKLKKYTHKEINEASMEARNAAGLIHTLDAMRTKFPINKTLRTEDNLDTISYYRYNEFEIDGIIKFFQDAKANGATHFNVHFDDDDSELLIQTRKMLSESPANWMDRVTKERDRLLDQAYGQKQREMLNYNEKVDTYLRLKRELGE